MFLQGHHRVGKALKGLGEFEQSTLAYCNAYKFLEQKSRDTVGVEILTELASVLGKIPFCKSQAVLLVLW